MVHEALHAAHIEPVSEQGSGSVDNGLLLRSDLHLMFDAGLLRLEVTEKDVVCHLDPVCWIRCMPG